MKSWIFELRVDLQGSETETDLKALAWVEKSDIEDLSILDKDCDWCSLYAFDTKEGKEMELYEYGIKTLDSFFGGGQVKRQPNGLYSFTYNDDIEKAIEEVLKVKLQSILAYANKEKKVYESVFQQMSTYQALSNMDKGLKFMQLTGSFITNVYERFRGYNTHDTKPFFIGNIIEYHF